MFWSSKAKGIDVSDAETANRCSFCKKAQVQVGKLVVGPAVAICDECVALSTAILEEDALDDELAFPSVVATACEVLKNPEISEERAAAAARIGAAAANGSVHLLGCLARVAFEAERFGRVVEMLEELSVESLADGDGILLAMAHWYRGEFEEGLRVIDAVSVEHPQAKALVMMMRHSFVLRLDADSTEASLIEMKNELVHLRRTSLLTELDLAYVLAEVLTRLGSQRAAKELLLKKEAFEELTGFETMILGDVTLALGDRPEAMRLYARAKELGGPMLGEVEQRLANLSPYR